MQGSGIGLCNFYLHIHFIGGSWEIIANNSSSTNIPLPVVVSMDPILKAVALFSNDGAKRTWDDPLSKVQGILSLVTLDSEPVSSMCVLE